MKFHRRETPPPPRPLMAVEFLQGEEELDKEVEFDPHRDIRQESLEEMRRALEKSRADGDWGSFGFMAMRLAIVFPERTDELGLDDEVWKGMKEMLEFELRETFWEEFAGLAGMSAKDHGTSWEVVSTFALFLAVLFPERRAELELDKEAWERMYKELEADRDRHWWGSGDMAVRLVILFPERRDELKLEETWSELRKRLDVLRRSTSRPGRFSHLAMNLALLFPEKRGELNLDEAWEKMKKDLETARRDEDSGGLSRFTDMAMQLTVLAAQEAYIDHSGRLRITSKKPALSSAPPPLPERPHMKFPAVPQR